MKKDQEPIKSNRPSMNMELKEVKTGTKNHWDVNHKGWWSSRWAPNEGFHALHGRSEDIPQNATQGGRRRGWKLAREAWRTDAGLNKNPGKYSRRTERVNIWEDSSWAFYRNDKGSESRNTENAQIPSKTKKSSTRHFVVKLQNTKD